MMMLGSRFALRSTNCRALRANSRNLANLASVRGPLALGPAVVQSRSLIVLFDRTFVRTRRLESPL
jgi:hypothetical protein